MCMSSFKKEEPTYRWEGLTSVLDHWNEKSNYQNNGEPLCKRMKPSVENSRSVWPFDWDWNGLFCHDFPLLELPDTVLLDICKMLDNDSRRELSFTNQKLRDMIVYNKSIDMDRRRIHDLADLSLCHGPKVVFLIPDDDFVNDVYLCFDLPQLEEFLFPIHYYNETLLVIHDDGESGHFELDRLPEVVKMFEGVTGRINVTYCWDHDSPDITVSSEAFEKMLTFLEFPLVKSLMFDEELFPCIGLAQWEVYRDRVSRWAIDKGMGVSRRQAVLGESTSKMVEEEWGFCKEKLADGREGLVIVELD